MGCAFDGGVLGFDRAQSRKLENRQSRRKH